jgi:hypothetical protein
MHIKGKKIAYVYALSSVPGCCLQLFSFERTEAEQYVRESHDIFQKKMAEGGSPSGKQ